MRSVRRPGCQSPSEWSAGERRALDAADVSLDEETASQVDRWRVQDNELLYAWDLTEQGDKAKSEGRFEDAGTAYRSALQQIPFANQCMRIPRFLRHTLARCHNSFGCLRRWWRRRPQGNKKPTLRGVRSFAVCDT